MNFDYIFSFLRHPPLKLMFFVFFEKQTKTQNNLKKTSRLHKTNEETRTKVGVCLHYSVTFWAWGLPRSVVHIPYRPYVTLFKKADFPFVIRYELQNASWLGVRVCVHSPFPRWDFVWFELVHVICYAITLSKFTCEWALLCLKTISLESPLSLAHIIILPFFYIDPWALREGVG